MNKDFTREAIKDDRFWNSGVGTIWVQISEFDQFILEAVACEMDTPANPEDFRSLRILSGFLEEL